MHSNLTRTANCIMDIKEIEAEKRSFNMALESSLSATLTLEAEYDAACYRSPETRQALRA